MTAVDESLVSLALHVGGLTAHDLDLPALLDRICTALPAATGVGAAVMLVSEPPDEEFTIAASDSKAGWIGEAQRRSGNGPLRAVIRSGRPLLTPDLTRLGPPELAAAAAESGLTSSLVVPLARGSEVFGALQLLAGVRRPLRPGQADPLRPLLDVLVARLVDSRELRRAVDTGPVAPAPLAPAVRVDPGDVATAVLPATGPPVPVPPTTAFPAVLPARVLPAPVPPAGPPVGPAVVPVPAPRRPPAARHRRADEDDNPPVSPAPMPPPSPPTTPPPMPPPQPVGGRRRLGDRRPALPGPVPSGSRPRHAGEGHGPVPDHRGTVGR